MTSIILTVNDSEFVGRLTMPPGHFLVSSLQVFAEMINKFSDLRVTITWR